MCFARENCKITNTVRVSIAFGLKLAGYTITIMLDVKFFYGIHSKIYPNNVKKNSQNVSIVFLFTACAISSESLICAQSLLDRKINAFTCPIATSADNWNDNTLDLIQNSRQAILSCAANLSTLMVPVLLSLMLAAIRLICLSQTW